MGPGLDLGNLLVHLRLNDSQFMRSIKGVEQKMLLTANKMAAIGRTMSMRVTLPILAIGAAAVKMFADLEEGFIGVQKTVNATAEEFVVLRRGLEQLSKTTPSSLREIFGAAEIGGQLGIATENLVDFTNTIIMMKNTSDLSIDAAAKQFARFANIVQMPQKNISNLASTLTELGNNSAATEGEIITLAMRIAATGSRVGLTNAEIVGMAASLTSLGVQAEMGGSGISRLFVELNKAAKNGTRELREFAKVAGMSRGEFQALFNMSAKEGILAYVEGLQRMQEAGIELSPTLDKVGLSGVRLNDIMGRLSGSGTLTRRMMTDATKAWKENTATVDEANKKYASFWSQLKITKNMIVLMAQDIGKVLEPMVLKLNNSVRKLSEWWFDLSENTKASIVHWSLFVAAVGPALVIVGGLIKSFIFIGAIISKLTPIGMLLTGIGLIIYGLFLAWKSNFMGMRDILNSFLDVIFEFVTYASAEILYFVKGVHKLFADLWPKILENAKLFAADFIATLSASLKVLSSGDLKNWADVFSQEFVRAFDNVTKNLSEFNETFNGSVEKTKKSIGEIANVTTKSIKEAIDEANKEMEGYTVRTENILAQFVRLAADQIEDLNEKWNQWQDSMELSLERGLMNMAQDWDNWADHVKQILKEVYYEALRLAFIQPLAQNLAGGVTSGMKSLLPMIGASAFTPATAPTTSAVPVNATGADGGYVGRTGFALIHKGETLSGTEGQYGGNLTLKLHYEGQPLVMSKEQSYMQSDQRIKEVWLSLADNDMAVRNRLKQG